MPLTQREDSARPDPAVGVWRPGGVPEAPAQPPAAPAATEIGGRADGTEPTRYGDWEKQGRCIDF